MLPRMNAFALFALLVVVGVASHAQASGPRYETRRLPNGPRPDRFMLVRVDRGRPAAPPYALTGAPTRRVERRVVQRWSGAHYIAPAWTVVTLTE